MASIPIRAVSIPSVLVDVFPGCGQYPDDHVLRAGGRADHFRAALGRGGRLHPSRQPAPGTLRAEAHRQQPHVIQLLAWLTGMLIFVESSISVLTVGLYRPVFDELKISREKLAYIADSSSAPSSIIIPFNGWGPFIMSLLVVRVCRSLCDDVPRHRFQFLSGAGC